MADNNIAARPLPSSSDPAVIATTALVQQILRESFDKDDGTIGIIGRLRIVEQVAADGVTDEELFAVRQLFLTTRESTVSLEHDLVAAETRAEGLRVRMNRDPAFRDRYVTAAEEVTRLRAQLDLAYASVGPLSQAYNRLREHSSRRAVVN